MTNSNVLIRPPPGITLAMMVEEKMLFGNVTKSYLGILRSVSTQRLMSRRLQEPGAACPDERPPISSNNKPVGEHRGPANSIPPVQLRVHHLQPVSYCINSRSNNAIGDSPEVEDGEGDDDSDAHEDSPGVLKYMGVVCRFRSAVMRSTEYE